jgi:cytochrome c peroxidase
MQSRSFSWMAALLLLVWLIFVCLIARGATATLPPPVPSPAPISPPAPLRTVLVPEPAQLDQFVADRAAAIRLGKALFWDMQVGSDGIQACGSCHFHAGADSRTKNQLNPDLNGSDPAFTLPGGPNYTLMAQDFPFHRLANPEDPSAVVADRNNVAGSQGVFRTLFVDIIPGSAVDQVVQLPDPVFNVQGIKTRRVEPRNAPTVINAIFNDRNFWDGRAQSDFNGVDPFGSRNSSAGVLKVDPATGTPSPVQTGITTAASLASLACGPAVNPNEMSADGRTLPKLGKKMLSLRPLAEQVVAPDDSVLGSLSRARALSPGQVHIRDAGNSQTGLDTTYEQMIQAAFRPEWWQSSAIVTYGASETPTVSLSADDGGQPDSKPKAHAHARHGGGSANPQDNGGLPPLSTDQYTVTEANFSLFFGLSIQLYLATLVADDTPFDRYLDGQTEALNAQQQAGLQLFFGKAGCARCHSGPELTEASFSNSDDERIDHLTNLNGVEAKYDEGFLNTGVRPIADDPGIGGTDPFGIPLADARRLKLGQLPPGTFSLDVGPDEPIAVDGAFKIPGLRNVELTAPYFHNGGMATLEQVVEFYNRGNDFAQQNRENVRDFIRPLGLTAGEKAALVAFLKSLTDERVRFERAPFDHPQIFVPNGHPGDQSRVISDGTGKARDALVEIKAVGAGGGAALSPVF